MDDKTKALSCIREPSNGYISKLEEDAFAFLKSDPIGLRDIYVNQHGFELNPDEMRKMFPKYQGYNTKDFDRAVGALTEIIYKYLLETRVSKGNNTVFFTAGGSGSGKSRTIVNLPEKNEYAIILDATFASKNSINKVIQAIDKGFHVRIMYVLRDLVEAWEFGVLPRTKANGRVIDEAYHLDSHREARKNVLKLHSEYVHTELVEFGFLKNQVAKELDTIQVEDLIKFTYNEREIAERIKSSTNLAYEKKELTQNQYQAIISTRQI